MFVKKISNLLIFHLDNPGGENHGYFRIGHDLDRNSTISDGWGQVIPVPGWFGATNQGASIAVGLLRQGFDLELFIMHIDNPHGENRGFYRIIRDLLA